MPVAMMVDNPQGSAELYDRVRGELGLDDKPPGGIVHAAGPSPRGGWRVIEVWESQEDAQRFIQERLMPALQKVGMPTEGVQPEFWELHNLMK